MRKIGLTIILFLFSSLLLISEENNDQIIDEIRTLIEEDLEENFVEIRDKSKDLYFDQKELLFEDYNKKIFGPVLLNLLPFGFGSFAQGDLKGGVTALGMDALFTGLVTYVLLSDRSADYLLTTFATLFAQIVYLTNTGYKIIRPIAYGVRFNRKLDQALGKNEKSTFSIAPGVSLSSGHQFSPVVRMRFSY